MNDLWYHTELDFRPMGEFPPSVGKLVWRFRNFFLPCTADGGRVYGTIAVLLEPRKSSAFITTARGKTTLEQWTTVSAVDEATRTVHASPVKATLNAPLLARIFAVNPWDSPRAVYAMVHFHRSLGFRQLPYAPPGTVRDSLRDATDLHYGFDIVDHGTFLLFDSQLRLIGHCPHTWDASHWSNAVDPQCQLCQRKKSDLLKERLQP